jgi:hypothetical protein
MKRWWLVVPLFFLVLLLIFLPQILSTTFGKEFLIHSIGSKTHTKVTIDSVSLSWMGPQKLSNLSMTSPEYQGHFETIEAGVTLWHLPSLFALEDFNDLNGDLLLRHGTLKFQKEGFESTEIRDMELFFRLHQGAADFTGNGSANQGSFSLQGQIQNFYNEIPDFSIHFELVSFPLLPIAHILQEKGVDEAVLLETIGTTINATGALSLLKDKGSLALSLQAPNVSGELHGLLTHQHLTLAQPLTLTLKLTPELAKSLLRTMNPLFLTGIQAQNPIHCRIEPRNFHYTFPSGPLGPFNIRNLQIGQGTLDLGKIVCRNGSSLAALVSMLKQDYFTRMKEMTVWCTPFSFHLKDGILEVGRMDALMADSIRICSWGTINLKRDKLGMTLGLTQETLQSAFNLKQVPKDYVLTIPVSGSTKDPQLATGVALAKIASLVGAEAASGTLPGSLLKLFAQPEGSVPPANRPFPWEGS